MRTFSPALAVLLCVSLLDAKQAPKSCGSYPERGREEVHLHQQSVKAGLKRIRKANVARLAGETEIDGRRVRPDSGNLALLDDTDGVVSRRNPFNLNKKTLRFVPSDGTTKYRYELGEDTYDAASAAGGTLIVGLGDDDSREISLPFAFRFYGVEHRSIFVNSDGNVTFGSGDVSITDRSLGRFTSGAPRIAALFRDLDPERARTGVTSYAGADRLVISWVQVPEFRDSGTGPLQTFQIRLYIDGRIEIAWSEITTQEAVTGISPGRLQGSASVVSFLNAPSAEYSGAVVERFAGAEQIDIFSAAQKFYLNHEDSYDYLVLYNTLNIQPDDDAVAFEVTIRNNRSGYGDTMVDIGNEAGSKRRLQAILNMGPVAQYPRDPNARVPARFSVGDTPLTTLAHEAGHLFLALASVRDENDEEARPMLGFQSAHWTFTFNSEASLLEGNRIQDNGPGATSRFLTTGTVEGFSPLDQYLMGLRAPQEVPDTFLVTNPTPRVSGLPRVGAAFSGDRRDIRIDEIIQAEGRRTPDHTVAQQRFRFAFVVITEAGKEPSAADLAQVEAYRTAFEAFYARATSNRAVADTTLKRALRVSTWPAAGVVAGASGRATVSIESPVATPTTVFLRPEGVAELPASIVIPAGQTQAQFTFTGRRTGVDNVIVEPATPEFETVQTRIQVAAPGALRLTLAGGNLQMARAGTPLNEPIQVRVTDVNNLPYPGLTMEATVSAGGVLDKPTAVTDENGVATFRWTPGVGPENELRASIPGGAVVIATALSRPTVATGGVVNAASFVEGVTPGGIATAFGLNLAGRGTSEVLLNGRPLTVFYSSTRQANFHIPFETQTGTADLVIRTNAGNSEVMKVAVKPVQPGVFFDTATGFGAVTGAGTGQVTQVRPVSRGETIEIYSTGLGAVELQPDGLRTTTVTPQVLIGGMPAEVTFSGLTPGYTGLYQVNVRVPAVASGPQPLVVTAAGASSNEVKIQIQ